MEYVDLGLVTFLLLMIEHRLGKIHNILKKRQETEKWDQ